MRTLRTIHLKTDDTASCNELNVPASPKKPLEPLQRFSQVPFCTRAIVAGGNVSFQYARQPGMHWASPFNAFESNGGGSRAVHLTWCKTLPGFCEWTAVVPVLKFAKVGEAAYLAAASRCFSLSDLFSQAASCGNHKSIQHPHASLARGRAASPSLAPLPSCVQPVCPLASACWTSLSVPFWERY